MVFRIHFLIGSPVGRITTIIINSQTMTVLMYLYSYIYTLVDFTTIKFNGTQLQSIFTLESPLERPLIAIDVHYNVHLNT